MIVLLGFKHVGKTSLGKALAQHLNLPFADLDQVLETQSGRSLRDWQSTDPQGLKAAEHQALKELLKGEGILSLGGSTPLHQANQALLKGHTCLHLTADKDQVFQWIQEAGWPSSFPEGEARSVFEALWEQRLPIYSSLAQHTFHNHNHYPTLVEEIARHLRE